MRNIFKLAWRNIWRNKRRTILTLVALAVGVLSVVFAKSYLKGILNSSSESLIKTAIGHVRIVHSEYLRLERIMPKDYLVPDGDALTDSLKKEAGLGVASVDQRIRFNVLLNNKDINEGAIAVGIVPEEADKTMKLSEAVVKGEWFPKGDPGLKLVIGRLLAKKLEVVVGDELLLVTTDINYSTYALPFKVFGIIETGFSNIDKHMLYIPLNKASEMLDTGGAVHEVLVFLDNPDAAGAAAETIKQILVGVDKAGGGKDIKVIPWKDHDLLKTALPMAEDIYDVILGIVMLIVALVILNTMLMAVMERYQEIGVMKALGFKDRESFMMILTEAFCLGTIGSLIGGAMGSALSIYLENTGLDFAKMMGTELWDSLDVPVPLFGKVVYPDFEFPIFIFAVIFGIIITLLAVLYPAYKSVRMQPVEAFRSHLKV